MRTTTLGNLGLTRVLALAATATLLASLAACGPATPELVERPQPERPPPSSPAEAAVYAAQDALAADFATFAAHTDGFQSDGHEAWLVVHANAEAAAGPGPDGLYDAASSFAAVEHAAATGPATRTAVMTKLDDGAWLYTALGPDGTVLLSGTADDPAVQDACAGCHTMAAAGTDAIFSR